jgi:putative phosphoribosyl transferase
MFADRADAGRRLAVRLSALRGRDVVILGLPRGGVPVAFQIAQSLQAPLDVIVVRKLGVPYEAEVAMGAIGECGVRVVNRSVVDAAGVTPKQFALVEQSERRELVRRVARFRGGRAPVPLDGRTAVVVDDGIATGATARAACQVVRALGAARVVLATPVAPPDIADEMRRYTDEVVCLHTPQSFRSIGQFYADFTQTSDAEVNYLLARPTRAVVPNCRRSSSSAERRLTRAGDPAALEPSKPAQFARAIRTFDP